ncbi:hypothetical protein ACFCYF_03365 [Streptomyces chartreusis]|uniref:hypothetical protein n=1 Tax=Streptomyces chartreusis TaxID=1969 RepID=UPI0035DE85A4
MGNALGYALWLIVAVGGVLVIGAAIWNAPAVSDGEPLDAEDSVTAAPSQVIDNPMLSDDEIEGSWYCWDTGAPAPHRLGYWVPDDHLCTWGELRRAGVTG